MSSNKINNLEEKLINFGIDESILKSIKKETPFKNYVKIIRNIYTDYKNKNKNYK